jgi:uncharacterized protein
MITSPMKSRSLKAIKITFLVWSVLFYACQNEIKDGFVIKHFPNGDVKYFSIKLKSLRNGPVAIFRENWQLVELSYFENDTLNGNYYKWDGNGCLKSITTYSKGMQDGLELIFYSNGKLESLTTYSKGSKNGIQRFFHDNGVRAREVFWKEGVLNGFDIFWYNNGVIKQSGYWIKGRTHGKYVQYFSDGSIEIQGDFRFGKKIKKWIYFSSNKNEPYIENYKEK